MMEDIQFFSKIQDQLLYLGNPRYNSAILSVVVNLMSTNYQGDSNYFYHEVVYPSSKMNTITTAFVLSASCLSSCRLRRFRLESKEFS